MDLDWRDEHTVTPPGFGWFGVSRGRTGLFGRGQATRFGMTPFMFHAKPSPIIAPSSSSLPIVSSGYDPIMKLETGVVTEGC